MLRSCLGRVFQKFGKAEIRRIPGRGTTRIRKRGRNSVVCVYKEAEKIGLPGHNGETGRTDGQTQTKLVGVTGPD